MHESNAEEAGDRRLTATEAQDLRDRVLAKEKMLEEQRQRILRLETERDQLREQRRETHAFDLGNLTPISPNPPLLTPHLSTARAYQTIDECGGITEPRREELAATATYASGLSVKDGLDVVPVYDGYNMSIFRFVKACERARDMLAPRLEPTLTQLIINKLKGHAFQVVEDSDALTITELTDRLRAIFGPRKSTNQYRGELGNIYKRNNEHILDYIGRIKDLKAAITDGERQAQGQIPLATREMIEADALDSFVSGLPSELQLRLRVLGIETLEDAFTKSVQITRTMENEASRNRQTQPRENIKRDFRPQQPENRNSYVPNPYHPRYEQPRTYRTQQQQGPQRTFGARPPQPPYNVSCNYCKIPGHVMSECRKLAYRRAQERSTPIQNSGNERSTPGTSGAHRSAPENGRQVMVAEVPTPPTTAQESLQ